MLIEQTPLTGVMVITPARFGDHRGFFSESYNRAKLADHGLHYDFVQDNHSLSDTIGTVRGLHFQVPPKAQAKLVRCGKGRFYDVVVDLRVGSPSFGAAFGTELSMENGKQMLVPVGFAHGCVTREPATEIIYKCSDDYAPAAEGAVRWNDPALGIDWGIKDDDAVLSDKDRHAPFLADFDSPFIYQGGLS